MLLKRVEMMLMLLFTSLLVVKVTMGLAKREVSTILDYVLIFSFVMYYTVYIVRKQKRL